MKLSYIILAMVIFYILNSYSNRLDKSQSFANWFNTLITLLTPGSNGKSPDLLNLAIWAHKKGEVFNVF